VREELKGVKKLSKSALSLDKMRNFARFMALLGLFTTMAAPLRSQAVGERKLEVFSWWTSGGEAAALSALFNVYKR
jgi:hypothetical protein